MTIRLIIAYLLNLFDLAMTNYWVNKYGLEIEGNPIGRWLYQTGAVYPVKIVGVGFLLWILYFATKKYPNLEWTSWLILGVYSLLALYHIYLLIKVVIITKGV